MNASARAPASLSTALAATALALFGTGAGLVSAPAAESMLGAVPKARAGVGVGSATNDTTIELGGALVTLAFLPARAKPHPVRVGGSQRGALPRSR
jgi:hypothetical protein